MGLTELRENMSDINTSGMGYAALWKNQMVQAVSDGGAHALSNDNRAALIEDFNGLKNLARNPEATLEEIHNAFEQTAASHPDLRGTVAFAAHVYFSHADAPGDHSNILDTALYMLDEIRYGMQHAPKSPEIAAAAMEAKIENPAVTYAQQPGFS